MEETQVVDHITCEQKLQASELAREQLTQRLTYLTADLDNMRRRFDKDRLTIAAYAQGEIIKKLLPIVDDFDRAFSMDVAPEVQQQLIGFEMVYKSFQKLLKELGVESVACDTFDPELHEAVMQVPDSGKEAGVIITIFEKGYQFKGAVLRPAKVSVAA